MHGFCKSLRARVSMVEVGAGLGKNSIIFAQYFKSVICVDPWGDGEIFTSFLERTMPYRNIRYLIMTGEEAADSFPEESLSFVFLDNVEDVKIWRPKIQIGGHIGGVNKKGERWLI